MSNKISKISKKERDIFVDAVTNGLLKMGAIIKPINGFDRLDVGFTLETSVGKLEISIRRDQTFMFMVFSRFEDVAKAKSKFDCNPHSGKYNFMMGKSGGATARQASKYALQHFKETLKTKKK
jgi:hypothetical protein